jgi:hypothetical protein
MTTDEQIKDLERVLKSTTASIAYYEQELQWTSALKPRFRMIQRQLCKLRSRQWRLERDIQTLKENGKEESK